MNICNVYFIFLGFLTVLSYINYAIQPFGCHVIIVLNCQSNYPSKPLSIRLEKMYTFKLREEHHVRRFFSFFSRHEKKRVHKKKETRKHKKRR